MLEVWWPSFFFAKVCPSADRDGGGQQPGRTANRPVHEVVTGEIELDFFAVEVLDQEGDQYLTENELVIDSGCSKVHVCPPEFAPS